MNTGAQLKLAGLELTSAKHKEALALAQLVAQFLGAQQNFVSVDDVFEWIKPESLGAAAGAIFRDSDVWEFVGWQPSLRESNHARPVRTWRLRANAR